MREPRAEQAYATPDDLPVSDVLPELLRAAKEGRVVYLGENDERWPRWCHWMADAGLAALGRRRTADTD